MRCACSRCSRRSPVRGSLVTALQLESGNASIARRGTRPLPPGDLWQLGPHRLICGDALARETMAALMDGERAQTVFTDPPYNVPIQGHLGGSGATRAGDLMTGVADQDAGARGRAPSLRLPTLLLIVVGQIHQCHGDHALAFAAYEEALSLAERIGDPQLLFPCYDGLATLNLDAGNLGKAEVYLAKSQEVCQRAGLEPDALLILPFLA